MEYDTPEAALLSIQHLNGAQICGKGRYNISPIKPILFPLEHAKWADQLIIHQLYLNRYHRLQGNVYTLQMCM